MDDVWRRERTFDSVYHRWEMKILGAFGYRKTVREPPHTHTAWGNAKHGELSSLQRGGIIEAQWVSLSSLKCIRDSGCIWFFINGPNRLP
jgi:hypothetical protein